MAIDAKIVTEDDRPVNAGNPLHVTFEGDVSFDTTNLEAGIGAPDDPKATSDTGTFSMVSLLKWIGGTLNSMFTDTSDTQVVVRAAEWEVIEASDTDEMAGSTGAVGDKLEALLVIPTATTVGAISIEYGSTNVVVYAGGTVGADLKPFAIPLFGMATPGGSGGWEITTGVGARVIAFGDFT